MPCRGVPCRAVPRHAVLWCGVLCHAVLCGAVRCGAVRCYAVLCCALPRRAVLCRRHCYQRAKAGMSTGELRVLRANCVRVCLPRRKAEVCTGPRRSALWWRLRVLCGGRGTCAGPGCKFPCALLPPVASVTPVLHGPMPHAGHTAPPPRRRCHVGILTANPMPFPGSGCFGRPMRVPQRTARAHRAHRALRQTRHLPVKCTPFSDRYRRSKSTGLQSHRARAPRAPRARHPQYRTSVCLGHAPPPNEQSTPFPVRNLLRGSGPRPGPDIRCAHTDRTTEYTQSLSTAHP